MDDTVIRPIGDDLSREEQISLITDNLRFILSPHAVALLAQIIMDSTVTNYTMVLLGSDHAVHKEVV